MFGKPSDVPALLVLLLGASWKLNVTRALLSLHPISIHLVPLPWLQLGLTSPLLGNPNPSPTFAKSLGHATRKATFSVTGGRYPRSTLSSLLLKLLASLIFAFRVTTTMDRHPGILMAGTQ